MATMSKQTSVYTLSEELKHFNGKHLVRYMGKLGLEMDAYLLPPTLFVDAVKCDPGTTNYAISNPL